LNRYELRDFYLDFFGIFHVSFEFIIEIGSGSGCCKFQLHYCFSCWKTFFAEHFAKRCFKNAS